MASKTVSVAVAFVVTVMVGVVVAASLGTQDDVPEATDPQPTHTPSETLGTVNGTPATLTEPQDSIPQTTEPPTQPAQSEEFGAVDIVVDMGITKSDLPKVVDVGVVIYELGTAQYIPEEIMANLGVNDFNDYLEEIGAHWRMNLVLTNSYYDPNRTLEDIQRLDSEGIKFVLGHIPSPDIHYIKSYVDSNDMVLISSWSSTPSLAVVDNIFRFSPSSSTQGRVLAMLFEQEGIEVVVPIYRGDDWNDGVYKSTKNSFEALGGIMDEGIRYSPESTAYSAEVSMLSDLVDEYTNQYPADKVAVLMTGFRETAHLLGFVDDFDNLHDVRWFGSDGSAKNSYLSDDPAASAFLQDVSFVSTLFSASKNDVYADVVEYFEPYSSSVPNSYIFSIYDSIWVLGKTILETDSVDPLTVRDALTDVASRHTGTIGTIHLNEFGDFATSSYGLWSVRDGQWYRSGYFDGEDNTFSFP